MKEFSAVLLAGGKSSRMGHDKALLRWRGSTLLAHQIATLRATAPAELWLSARDPIKYRDANLPTIIDRGEEIGPLGGIVAALEQCRTPWLLVLAVDMPEMTVQFLLALVREAGESCGVISRHAARFEPLAAVYPREALSYLDLCSKGFEFSLQKIARDLCARGLLRVHELAPDEELLFRNLNTPTDVAYNSDVSCDSVIAHELL